MLYFGRSSLMRLSSRIKASSSVSVTVYWMSAVFSMSFSMRVEALRLFWKYCFTRFERYLALPT